MAELTLPGGRVLSYVAAGPADGTPLYLHHGTPSSGLVFEPLVEAAARHGLRIVSHSRPGYAGSTPLPGRTVAAVADDVAAVLDHLGAGRFLSLGWSGGGPHTLATAALLTGRCAAAATIAGVAPYDAEGLDWLGGMGAENIEEFGAAAAGEAELTAFLEAQAPALATVQAQQMATAMGDLVSDVDRGVITDEFAEYLAASFRSALSTGIAGWRDDDLAFVRDWGFDLATIGTPLSIWQGEQDRMVPYAHGRWLAAHLPGATAHLDPAAGHLSLMVTAFDRVVAELVTHLP
ncbi:alpha/beta fold hydrolase [Actinoplanes sp. N902-109]|uniref:alpha/beta fold hydrolase n=1 Tax=Actinoplanes sp. (strain N902-109) TaxID=649831 RepID=UPI0003293FD2|nr:alpha/beta hydrolase [Actinoplanes sp. N902-109]AGL18154.1 alpha/beta hydrolase fold protein [Actinoplanes sp. N902-109]